MLKCHCHLCVSDAEEAVTNVTLQQPYEMGSAYNNPKYTNFTTGFAACLDYIFYEKNKLRVVQVRTVEENTYFSLVITLILLTGCAFAR